MMDSVNVMRAARCAAVMVGLVALGGMTGCHGERPAIDTAIHNGNQSEVDAQLAGGAKLEQGDNHGMTPLNYAVWDKHPGTVRMLLDKGANPNTHDERGNTPLYYAVRHDSEEMISALLDKGADPNAKCEKDVTPLELAQDRGYTSIVTMMKAHGGR